MCAISSLKSSRSLSHLLISSCHSEALQHPSHRSAGLLALYRNTRRILSLGLSSGIESQVSASSGDILRSVILMARIDPLQHCYHLQDKRSHRRTLLRFFVLWCRVEGNYLYRLLRCGLLCNNTCHINLLLRANLGLFSSSGESNGCTQRSFIMHRTDPVTSDSNQRHQDHDLCQRILRGTVAVSYTHLTLPTIYSV